MGIRGSVNDHEDIIADEELVSEGEGDHRQAFL